MKLFFFAFFTFFVFGTVCKAQQTALAAKVAIGFSFSPDYSYRYISSDAASNWIADDREDFEVPKFGFTVGPRILFTLGNRIALESGLLFSDKGEKTTNMKYAGNPGDSFLPYLGRHNYHYYYLDVPVKTNYYITSNKVKVFVSAGASANFFMAEKRSSTYTFADGSTTDRTVKNSAPFNRIDVAGIAGAGVDYEVTNKLQIRLEPVYRRSLVSIINTPIKSQLYSAGINFGVFMKL